MQTALLLFFAVGPGLFFVFMAVTLLYEDKE